VDPTATVYTDEWAGYRNLHSTHPTHLTIRYTDRVYASGEIHTQTIEGFFGNVKNGIAGNYHGVSANGSSPMPTSTHGATATATRTVGRCSPNYSGGLWSSSRPGSDLPLWVRRQMSTA
jgi:hypothetical protein